MHAESRGNTCGTLFADRHRDSLSAGRGTWLAADVASCTCFGGLGEKDKKRKYKKKEAGILEEIKEEPKLEPEQGPDTWSTWGTVTTAKKAIKQKKSAFDDAFAATEEKPATNRGGGFGWGSIQTKEKRLDDEVDERSSDN